MFRGRVVCVLTWVDVISASGGPRVVRPPAAKTQALGVWLVSSKGETVGLVYLSTRTLRSVW